MGAPSPVGYDPLVLAMHLLRISRRTFLTGAFALSAYVRLIGRQGGTKLILLGTGGGPRPRKVSSGSAQVVVSNGVAYVIDCGDGVARQLAFAGVPFPSLRHIFITHQHSDHTADYGNLIQLAWTAGLNSRVDSWGPPPLARMTQLFFEMNASDIDIRIANEGRPPLAPLVHVHELREGGAVMSDERESHGGGGGSPSGRSSIRLPVRCSRPIHRHLWRYLAVAESREARRRR
jgi:hypothetical protein